MNIQPWQISSWPIIEQATADAHAIAMNLHHLGTVVSDDCDEFGRLLGHTIWGDGTSGKIGVAWDWTETLDGVFALSDPMAVISNIDFVDTRGVSIDETMMAVKLNQITHSLPWQVEVSRATRPQRDRAPWSTRQQPSLNQRFRPSELGGFVHSR
jgi:hypothetical protein